MKYLIRFFLLIICASSINTHSLYGQTCEICTNGIDDDGNGLIDCEDPVCNCQEEQPIVVCFIPESRCIDDCGYTLDGDWMEDYTTAKLLNTDNFGPDGIVKCPIELAPINGTISISSIQSAQCDIFFIGSIGGVTCSGPSPPVEIPDDEIIAIRNWSMLEDKNLVIATQVSALHWGYDSQNSNVNPNIPTALGLTTPIFNGPFGSVSSFDQGGCYQGVYTSVPSTGVQLLAIDSSPTPKRTIGIDNITNDIVIADVGVLTLQGGISFGPELEINNNNDILAANIFALACDIVAIEICNNGIDDDGDGLIDSEDSDCQTGGINTINAAICQGDPFMVNGMNYSATGTYLDTIFGGSVSGCDSIIVINLTVNSAAENNLQEQACQGSPYTVNGIQYFTTGFYTDTLQNASSSGCDSIITLDLIVFDVPEINLDEQICAGKSFTVNGNEYTVTGMYIDTISAGSSDGCDSIVVLDLEVVDGVNLSLEETICQGKAYSFNGESLTESGQYIDTINSGLPQECDSIVTLNLTVVDTAFTRIIEELEEGRGFIFNGVNYTSTGTYTIPILGGTSMGCDSIVILEIRRALRLYVPNAFSPNDDGLNDYFTIFANDQVELIEEFVVFNRWGDMVYKNNDFLPNNLESGWDGYFNGERLDSGVFIYSIDVKLADGQTMHLKGDITLIK